MVSARARSIDREPLRKIINPPSRPIDRSIERSTLNPPLTHLSTDKAPTITGTRVNARPRMTDAINDACSSSECSASSTRKFISSNCPVDRSCSTTS